MDRFLSLSVFVAAVEEGSIAAAARRHDLSPVMAGRYLTALETQLSARLVERTTRRLSLTEAGQAYYESSKRILGELAEAGEAAADLQASPRGVLRVAAPVTFGSMYLAPIVASYLTEFPSVDVALHLQDRFVDLVEEGVDLAIRIGQLPDSDLVARKLSDCQLVVCAAPRYLAAAGTPTVPDELAAHARIGWIGKVTTAPWSFTAADGTTRQVDGRCRFTSTHTEAMLAVALAGGGVVYGPDFVFARHLANGDLVPLLPGWRSPVLPLHAITPTARHVNLKTRLFIDRLREAFAAPAPWQRWAAS